MDARQGGFSEPSSVGVEEGHAIDPYRFAPAEHVARLQAKYVRLFVEAGVETVLDLGCGRGIFLQLLRDAGKDGIGVDTSLKAVELCHSRGLKAIHGDAVDVLEQLLAPGKSFGGVFCSHLIEHLPGDRIELLIQRSAAALAPGGLLIVVTPNAESLQVLAQGFWLDMSHVRLVPRVLLETMMTEAGLRIVRSGSDADAVSEWQAAPLWRKILWRFAFGRGIIERYLLSGLDAYVVGRRAGKDGGIE